MNDSSGKKLHELPENKWWIYKGTSKPNLKTDEIERLLKIGTPGWRPHGDEFIPLIERNINQLAEKARGAKFQTSKENKEVIDLVNTALYLRRPLFITGRPGFGKSSLAYAVAYELKLGPVLKWPITTKVTLQDGLYRYDAIGRLQAASLRSKDVAVVPVSKRAKRDETHNLSKDAVVVPDIGEYLQLGPLGTALLPTRRPRVLLIDEIDKSDIDLPNDLLNIFEEGEYEIPELSRMSKQQREVEVRPYDSVNYDDRVTIVEGRVHCAAFPFVVLTSNGEREFPPAFLRRCLRLEMKPPDKETLTNIVKAHLGPLSTEAEQLIENFHKRLETENLATDQLLNAIYLTTHADINVNDRETLKDSLLKSLGTIS